MDLSKLSAQVKGFQRRTTQKVLQQMGIAEKTEDEGQAYQNFLALGSFASQLKTTIQAADTCFEKACTAQTHLAGQIQSYLSSELSGDAETPPGELHDFFDATDTTGMHAQTLQEVSEKFYAACSELGNNALHAVLGKLDDLVIRPIMNDEDFAPMTKDIVDEKKKATLDFDSYRRLAASNNPDQDKVEAKLRAARDRHELASRRLAEHIDMRNQVRCKLLVHGIVTAMQQYCNYYNHAINIFRDTALSIKPLLELYQMNDTQLQTTLNLHDYSGGQSSYNSGGRSSPKQQHTNASSVFDDYERQNNHKPKPSVAKTSAAGLTRVTSPHIDDMMRDNTLNLGAKPTSQPLKNQPMNQYGATNKSSPQAPHHVASPQLTHHHHASPQPPHQSQQPGPRHQSPPTQRQVPSQPTAPQVNLFDPTPQRVHSPVPIKNVLVDLNSSNDLLFGGSLGGNIAPPMQPANADPFASFATPTPQPPKPTSQQPKPTSSAPVSDDLLFASPVTSSRFPTQPANNDPFATFNAPPTNMSKKPSDDFADLFGPPTTSAPNIPSQQKQQPFTSPPASAAASSGKKQEERSELNPAVTNRINNWASKGGRQTNLRALLSTLHEVIWVDSGWDALPLTDLITGAQVKKAYIRANLIVHPDKVQTGTAEQQLIAQRLFEALRVSYETFKDEPK